MNRSQIRSSGRLFEAPVMDEASDPRLGVPLRSDRRYRVVGHAAVEAARRERAARMRWAAYGLAFCLGFSFVAWSAAYWLVFVGRLL